MSSVVVSKSGYARQGLRFTLSQLHRNFDFRSWSAWARARNFNRRGTHQDMLGVGSPGGYRPYYTRSIHITRRYRACNPAHVGRSSLRIDLPSGCSLGFQPQGQHQQTDVSGNTQSSEHNHDVAAGPKLLPAQPVFSNLAEELLVPLLPAICTD